MKKRSIPTAVALAMILPFSVPAHLGAQIDELAVGIRQVQEGDLDAAVITLDTVIQRLSKVKGAEKDVATAHLYLGMAHLGLSQWERAKAEMREAWRNNKDLRLDPQSFSPRVRQMFDDAKREAATAESATKQSDEQTAVNPGTNPQPPPVAKKGGSKALFIVGGVAVTGGAAAAMAGGGGVQWRHLSRQHLRQHLSKHPKSLHPAPCLFPPGPPPRPSSVLPPHCSRFLPQEQPKSPPTGPLPRTNSHCTGYRLAVMAAPVCSRVLVRSAAGL